MMFGDEPFKVGPIIPVEVPPDDLSVILNDGRLSYRCEQFLAAGLTLEQARTLTLDNTVDLHFVVDRLVGRGCDPFTAFDIAS
jgi:hypothetical protein